MGNVASETVSSRENSIRSSYVQNEHYTSYSGHRMSRRIEDDYVDISSELDVVLTREEMEVQFTKIVVSISFEQYS